MILDFFLAICCGRDESEIRKFIFKILDGPIIIFLSLIYFQFQQILYFLKYFPGIFIFYKNFFPGI